MRTLNRAIVAIVGLALLAGGVLAAIEIAVAFAGGKPWVLPYDAWYRNARTHDWQNGTARAVFVLLAATGLILLALQVLRRRPSTVALHSDSAVTYTLRRRNLEQSLTRSVRNVDGVESAAVKIGRHAVRIDARSHRQLPGDVKPSIQTTVEARLRELQLEDPPAVRTNLRLRRDAS